MSISTISGSSDPYQRYFLSRIPTGSQTIEGNGTQKTASANGTNETATAADGVAPTVQEAIRSFLPEGASQIDEESLFMAILGQRIQAMKGDEAAQTYQTRVQEHLEELAAGGAYASVELAARAALTDFYEEAMLTEEEAQTLHAQAFKSAQLDDNSASLYDGRGGEDDPTMTVADISKALASAEALLTKFDNNEEVSGTMPLDIGNTGIEDIGKGDGSSAIDDVYGGEIRSFGGGFVFKPVSEKDGNLVILLPSEFAGEIVRLQLFGTDGTLIETGDDQGETNGNRPTFRFDQPGADYPANIQVVATLTDGTERTYSIPDPSQRYT